MHSATAAGKQRGLVSSCRAVEARARRALEVGFREDRRDAPHGSRLLGPLRSRLIAGLHVGGVSNGPGAGSSLLKKRVQHTPVSPCALQARGAAPGGARASVRHTCQKTVCTQKVYRRDA
jgi:hypothetical protein